MHTKGEITKNTIEPRVVLLISKFFQCVVRREGEERSQLQVS